MGRTLTFHLNSGVVLESMGRLDDLCDQLVPYPNFLRPHRSFLINMEYIANIAARSITMQDLSLIHISPKPRKVCRLAGPPGLFAMSWAGGRPALP